MSFLFFSFLFFRKGIKRRWR